MKGFAGAGLLGGREGKKKKIKEKRENWGKSSLSKAQIKCIYSLLTLYARDSKQN